MPIFVMIVGITNPYFIYFIFIFQEMCSLSLRISAHMKHAYKMFYNVIDYGSTDW